MAPSLTRHLIYTVTSDESGMRLDRWIRRHFPHLSQGMLQKHLRKRDIQVEGKKASADLLLQGAQQVSMYTPLTVTPPTLLSKPTLPAPYTDEMLDQVSKWICYEDEDLLALEKPHGWPTQGGTGIKHHVLGALEAWFKRKHPQHPQKPLAVHRLDQETSGLLLVALTPFAATKLSEAFRNRQVEKTYHALVLGHFPEEQGTLDFFLKKTGEKMVALNTPEENALESKTNYKILKKGDLCQKNVSVPWSFAELSPLTGRTHQLRVHCLAAAGPILGDGKYGGKQAFPLGRQPLHLHATSLTFPHPRGKQTTLKCALPSYFGLTLNKLDLV